VVKEYSVENPPTQMDNFAFKTVSSKDILNSAEVERHAEKGEGQGTGAFVLGLIPPLISQTEYFVIISIIDPPFKNITDLFALFISAQSTSCSSIGS
jgi:hypothetical protein